MNKVKKIPKIHLSKDNPLAQGLLKMVEHKRLREQFWMGKISFEEFNKLLREKGINKQYKHHCEV
jgi:hypothetical protein